MLAGDGGLEAATSGRRCRLWGGAGSGQGSSHAGRDDVGRGLVPGWTRGSGEQQAGLRHDRLLSAAQPLGRALEAGV